MSDRPSSLPAGLALFLGLIAGVLVMAWWFRSLEEKLSKKLPFVETFPPATIVKMEVPINSEGNPGQKSLLKAAYATQINEKEIRIYGGFEYLTPTKRIVGDEGIIELSTGRVRNVKNIKIWDR